MERTMKGGNMKKACANCPFRNENFISLSARAEHHIEDYIKANDLEEQVPCTWLVDREGKAHQCAGYLASISLDCKLPRDKDLKEAMEDVDTEGIVRFSEMKALLYAIRRGEK
jgi:hypothetical protein